MSRLGYHSCRTGAPASGEFCPTGIVFRLASRSSPLAWNRQSLAGDTSWRKRRTGAPWRAHFVTERQVLCEVGVPTLQGVPRRQRDKLTPGPWLLSAVITAMSSSPSEESYFWPQSADNHINDEGPTTKGGIESKPRVTYLFDRLDAGSPATETWRDKWGPGGAR
jgi:hypothetical protein